MHVTASTDNNNLFIHTHEIITKQKLKWKYDGARTYVVLSTEHNHQSVVVKKAKLNGTKKKKLYKTV